MPIPSQPYPSYNSSLHVRNAIALAYSTVNNPRGLEVLWYSPYDRTFNELVTPFDGAFLVNVPYTMWIPSLTNLEKNLRDDFKQAGMDFEDTTIVVSDEDDDNRNVLSGLLDDNRSGSHAKSTREVTRRETQAKANEKRERKLRKALLAERAEFYHQLEQSLLKDRSVHAATDGNVSIQSMELIHEEYATNRHPDIFMNHVRSQELKKLSPDRGPKFEHYVHHGGRKVLHQCGALIAEVKGAPGRLLPQVKYVLEIGAKLDEAKEQLYGYCSIYFECYKNAKSIMVLAASGPFWEWRLVERDDVPEWDHLLQCPSSESEDPKHTAIAFIDDFEGLSPDEPFILGTKESDQGLTDICTNYLSPMLEDSH